MAGFTFNPDANRLTLEIEGETFIVDPFAKNVVDGATIFSETVTGIDFGAMLTPETSEQIDKAIKAVAEMVNTTLGPGAYKKLCKGRELGVMDHFELAMHIAVSINAFRAKRIERFLGGSTAMLKDASPAVP